VSERPANRLATETSPYLLQHAHNPVDWYPWGDEALAAARDASKPIFLSVGYAACHWCHVMERESFEDDDTAQLMNERFVSIKVDREERPDIDGIYMEAVQAMTGSGGWPMSVFLTPEGRPFYAGTYYPPEPRHGMPSFRQVLTGIADAWDERRDEIVAQAGRITDAIRQAAAIEAPATPLTADVTRAALGSLRSAFDGRWGGFGGAPKFPQPMTLEFVLRQALRDVPDALEMVTITLDRMAEGGIFDQVGGGFARYSTDGAWHVPHFEKMLYDNAQLLQLFTRTWQVTGDDRLRRIATRTADSMIREMRQAEGGFSSSQDADSEGVEGKFFTWTWDELVELVGEPVARCFGATPEGNWPGEGTNVLWRPVAVGAVARELGVDEVTLERDAEAAETHLFEARERRIRPGIDDKVLTAWNALAIRAFAEAGEAFDEPRYLEVATSCAEFVSAELRNEAGRLSRTWRRGVRGGPGFCDDHALLASACLTLYEITGDLRWFQEARTLADELLRLFIDDERGGFFQTGSDVAEIVVRPKDLYDNAVPSGNSAAAEALLRLSMLTGEARYEDAALSALGIVRDAMSRAPTGFGHALCALDLWLGPSHEVAIVGDPDDARTRALTDVIRGPYRPSIVLARSAPGDRASADAVALLKDRGTVDGRPTAYVCEHLVCRLPVTTPEELAELLSNGTEVT
jgi:uncharacterized protein YyaL (SSP411 family)